MMGWLGRLRGRVPISGWPYLVGGLGRSGLGSEGIVSLSSGKMGQLDSEESPGEGSSLANGSVEVSGKLGSGPGPVGRLGAGAKTDDSVLHIRVCGNPVLT